MRASWWDYVREAFNARPIGMFVAPNWIALAACGLLAGVTAQTSPEAGLGVVAIGTGMEMAYLWALSSSRRFQRFVEGKLGANSDVHRRLQHLVTLLPDLEKRRYAQLAQRCQAILEQQFHADANAPGYAAQSDSLGKLTWMYLRLLVTRQAIQRVIREGQRAPGEPPPVPGTPSAKSLEQRQSELMRRLADRSLAEDLRRSLASQLELVQQRLERRNEAGQKLQFLDAELARIEEQVELIREQAVLSTDPERFSERIDEISATLGTTGQWIADQQQTLGAMDDLISEPPPLAMQTRAREMQ